MRVGQLRDLPRNCVAHGAIGVAETRDRRAARRVEITAALAIDQVDAVARNGDRIVVAGGGVKNLGPPRRPLAPPAPRAGGAGPRGAASYPPPRKPAPQALPP